MHRIKHLSIVCNLSLLLLSALSCTAPKTSAEDVSPTYTNALVDESSPYLLQHAHNPVDWFPWGQQALEKAKQEDKPIIISVGYAACHWCHVMEHESFEDTTVARVMNEHFVSIKVDREERPDVDNVYMTACQLLSERGCGWPLNAIALPDGRPVWVGTYFPNKQWKEILQYFVQTYQDEKEELTQFAARVNQGIAEAEQISPPTTELSFEKSLLDDLAEKLIKSTDKKYGGRKGAPKFPLPNQYEFLLYYHHLTKSVDALEVVELSLEKMAKGGLYDQLGGGFARYSTDSRWLVPHFEKMLYDNAQLISLYSQAHQLTQNEFYQTVVEESIQFVERELSDPDGGFYSSLDADSEGEEGLFYIWKASTIDSLLDDERTRELFKKVYDVSKRGNWEGHTILNQVMSLETAAADSKLSVAEVKSRLASAKSILFEARASRIRPGLDDKILTSWNALMLLGLIDAYKALGNRKYLALAIKNATFLEREMMQPDGSLLRNHKDGKSVINAFLDDYAFLIQAFVALYQVSFDSTWLEKANQLAEHVQIHFADPTSGLYFYTSDLDPPLITRKMELTDNVISSSNSAMAIALQQLGTITYNKTWKEQALRMVQTLTPTLRQTEQPSYYSNWAQAYATLAYPLYEVAIVGADYEQLQAALAGVFLPNALYLGGATEGDLALLQGKLQVGETYIYVCRNNVCQLPVQTLEAALKQLQ
ncbi:MAG: thioredoxin domain-containing protein [Bacteroidota bacterium]